MPHPGSIRRVAVVSDCYLPNMGGIEVQAHDLAACLQVEGVDVTVFTATPGPPELDGVRIERLSMPATNRRLPLAPINAPYSPSVFRELTARLVEGHFDVVHCHGGVLSPLAFMGARGAQAAGLPVVITTHCLWSYATPLFRWLDRRSAWTTWPVVLSAVSDVAAEPVRRVAGPGVDVSILPNGIDEGFWHVQRQPRDPSVFTVAAVMRLAPASVRCHCCAWCAG